MTDDKKQPFGGKGDHDGDGKTGGAAKADKLITVKIKRDFWDKDGERHSKGTIVEIPIEAALDGVEAGTLERVKG